MLLSENLSKDLLEAMMGLKSASGNAASTVAVGKYQSAYIGLSTADPGTDGNGFAEPEATKGYARLECHGQMSMTYRSFALGEETETTHTRRIGNKDELSFHEAGLVADPDQDTGADWGTITHICLFTAATGGTPYAWCRLDKSVEIKTHQKFILRAGHFEVYLDGDELAAQAAGEGA